MIKLDDSDWEYSQTDCDYWEGIHQAREITRQSDAKAGRTRCGVCGRFRKRTGICSMEVYVERGWLTEHL